MSIIISFSVFFLSYAPLWLTVLFIDMKSLIEGGGNKCTELISIAIILVGTILSLIIFGRKLRDAGDDRYSYTISTAKESKMITAEFLLSYILPLFAFDFTQWDEVVKFLIFFLSFGYLCICHNSFSVNIVLELMGYRMYECELRNGDNKLIKRTIISKETLTMRKGEEIQINVLNNEFCIEIRNQ